MYNKLLTNILHFSSNHGLRVLLFVLVLASTFVLRSIHSDRIPQFGHLEEHLYGWSGMYLIEEGAPVSWSTLDYPKKNIIYSGPIYGGIGNSAVSYVDLVKPWLDEPPLFSLITGGTAHLFGADRHQLIPPSYLRFPMLFVSLFTSLVLFLLGRKLFGFWIGLGALLIWGTVPLFVFSSRLAVPENVIVLLYLLALYLFLLHKDRANLFFFLLLCIIPGVAGLMKPTGFFIAPLIAFLFFQTKQWKKGAIIMASLIPFIAAFIIYGIFWDPQLFLKILAIQGLRPAGWNALTYLLSNPAFDIFPFYDAWYLFAWIIAMYILLKPDKDTSLAFLSLAFIYWVLVVILSGGEQDLLPWYRYPLFPILAIYLALGLRHIFKNPSFFTLTLAAGFLPGNYIHLVNAFHPNISSSLFRSQLSALALPGILFALWQTKFFKQICQAVIVLVIASGILINVLVVKNYYSRICEAKICPIGPSTFLTR